MPLFKVTDLEGADLLRGKVLLAQYPPLVGQGLRVFVQGWVPSAGGGERAGLPPGCKGGILRKKRIAHKHEDVDRTCKSVPGDQSRGGVVLEGGVWKHEGHQLKFSFDQDCGWKGSE